MPPKKVTPYQMRQGLTYQHETPRFLQSMYKSLGLNPQPRIQNGDSDTDSTPTVAQEYPPDAAFTRKGKAGRNASRQSDDEGADSVLKLPLDDQPQVVVVDSTKHLSMEQAQALAQRSTQASGTHAADGMPAKIVFKSKTQRRNPGASMTTPNDKRRLDSETKPPTAITSDQSESADSAMKRRRTPKAKTRSMANRNVLSFDDEGL